MPYNGIITLEKMADLIDMVNKNRIIKLSNYKDSPIYIKDEELQFVDGLLDDTIINRLLSYHDRCAIPMQHVDIKGQDHEYRCNTATGECQCSSNYQEYRFIPVDGGFFQRIPYHTDLIQQAHDIRKNCERPFNLLKKQTGLEKVRVRRPALDNGSLHPEQYCCLVDKMSGTRKKQPAANPQQLPMFEERKSA